MLVWKLGLIFLAYLFINIALLLLTLFKQGKLVKNKIAFSALQVYTIALSVLIMCQNHAKIQAYLVGVLYLTSALAAIIIKSKDFFLARIITVETILLVNIAIWYTNIAIFIISIFILVGTYKARENYKRRGY